MKRWNDEEENEIVQGIETYGKIWWFRESLVKPEQTGKMKITGNGIPKTKRKERRITIEKKIEIDNEM